MSKFIQTFKNIDDLLYKDAGCNSETYDVEQDQKDEAELQRKEYTYI
ncbi:MAG: hypothetical protein Q4A09_02760 [Capnocytophaga felis]|nr:hypothetical protein [Capnocytophaga felis]